MYRISSIFIYLFLCVWVTVRGQDTIRLEAGHRIEKVITASEKHTYLINLATKQFVYGEVSQDGVNVTISVLNPDGKQIGKFDLVMGLERFYIETLNGGNYRIEVIPLMFSNPTAGSGKYDIEIKQFESLGDTPEKKTDQLLRALYKDDGPGGAVAVVHDGKIIYSRAYGMANMPHRIPFTTETSSNIGSVSKQFTGFAIALLEKQGKLSIDDDIRKYIPECPVFDKPVTIQNLLNHTSGYREIRTTFVMKGIRGHWTRQELIQQIQRQRELQNAPGSRHSYSNTGYLLLAEVVERVSGVSFPEWMETNVFGPLGMKHTTVNSPLRYQIQKVVPNSAQGYLNYGREYGIFPDEPAYYGASSIYSTINDLSRWLMNFHNASVGGPEVISRMTKRSVLTGGDTINYVFGLNNNKLRNFRRYTHDGFDGFHWTEMSYFPDIDLGIIILNNFPIFPTLSSTLSEVFIGEYIKSTEADTPQESKKNLGFEINPAILNTYAGRYVAKEDDRMIVTFVREGNLLSSQVISGKFLPSFFSLRAVSDSTFINENLDISVTFHLDMKRQVKLANFRYDGDFTLRRLSPYMPSEKDLLVFTGLYYSPELEVVYTINIENKRLAVKDPSGLITNLAPKYSDAFSGGFLGEYLFKRNENGNVSGFIVQNVYFEKLK